MVWQHQHENSIYKCFMSSPQKSSCLSMMVKSEIIFLMFFITSLKKNPFSQTQFPMQEDGRSAWQPGILTQILWEKVDETGSVNFSVIPGPSDSDQASYVYWHIFQFLLFSVSIGFIFRMQLILCIGSQHFPATVKEKNSDQFMLKAASFAHKITLSFGLALLFQLL